MIEKMHTVLIIDDDKILQDMYRDKLALMECNVLVANNGEEGLALALNEKPDLILLDIAMPKLDGMEVMKKLRADPWGKSVSIIVLTNLNVDGKLLEEVVQGTPAYCIMKVNATPEEIGQKVNELLKKKEKSND